MLSDRKTSLIHILLLLTAVYFLLLLLLLLLSSFLFCWAHSLFPVDRHRCWSTSDFLCLLGHGAERTEDGVDGVSQWTARYTVLGSETVGIDDDLIDSGAVIDSWWGSAEGEGNGNGERVRD